MPRRRYAQRPRNQMNDVFDMTMGATKALIGVEVMGITLTAIKGVKQ